MSALRVLFVLCLLAAAPLAAQNTQADWGEPIKDSEGIRVFARPVSGSAFKAFRAEVELTASLDSVLALMDDFPACTRWVHQCKEGRLLEETGFNDKTFYQATNMPFPVKDRDYILRAQLFMHDDKQGVNLTLSARPQAIPETVDIRLQEISGHYDFRKDVNQEGIQITHLVWEQHIDPAGKIPTWLVNALLVDIPFNSLRDFRALVSEEPYKSARLSYDDSGNIIGFSDRAQ